MSRATRIYNAISPFSLAAIVMLNFLLIYMNLVNLENQGTLLQNIEENTEIGIVNQELGLNVSEQNQDMLERIIGVQQKLNETLRHLNLSESDLS